MITVGKDDNCCGHCSINEQRDPSIIGLDEQEEPTEAVVVQDEPDESTESAQAH